MALGFAISRGLQARDPHPNSAGKVPSTHRSGTMIHVDETSLDQTISLPIGQVMELRLKENPTTGFRWKFETEGKPSCTVVGDVFEPRESPAGTGGEHAWQIKAERPGTCDLHLSYRRPFEPDAPPARSFTLRVRVTE